METSINEKSKVMEIWMTGADQRDEACAAQVKSLIKIWHGRGYMPVVYKSGTENLLEMTSALLKSNRDRLAGKMVKEERAAKSQNQSPVIEM